MKHWGKRKIITFAVAVLLIIILSIIAFTSIRSYTAKVSYNNLFKSTSYAQVADEDSKTDSEFVEFDAFFLRDLDGDGIANGIRGTCKELGKSDDLYFEVKVSRNGYLENGKITINANNCYVYGAIVKDTGVKENAIGPNIKEINFNTLNNGVQKLLIVNVRSGDYSLTSETTSAIGTDINKYSGINSVTFTGTHIAEDGTETEISKTVEFEVDWYGKLNCEIPEIIRLDSLNLNHEKLPEEVLDETNQVIKFDFPFGIQETKNQAILKKAYIEGTIPEFCGYKPSKVEITGVNTDFTYDEETGIFTATRNSVVDENGIVTTQTYTDFYNGNRINEINIHIEYPIEAYATTDESIVSLTIPVSAYYEGYNNTTSEEFENPLKSNVATATIHARVSVYREGDFWTSIRTGKYVSRPVSRYVVEKSKILNMYNGSSILETEDRYRVKWSVGANDMPTTSGTLLRETPTGEEKVSDQFITYDNQYISMENIVTNVGVAIEYADEALGEDGWVKVYDDESDELLVTFTKDNWSDYTEDNYYEYPMPVKHIRVETSNIAAETYLNIHNLKEIDDEYIVNNFSREEFDNLKRIESYLTAAVNGETIDSIEHLAIYEAPISIAEVSLSKREFTTQQTEKDVILTINTETEKIANAVKWKNGSFLVKFPQEVLNVDINNISISNQKVEITSYDAFEENGIEYIRVLTSNDEETTFSIDIDCDITLNPRVLTVNRDLELYATNEIDSDYFYSGIDASDVNQNGNISEIVNYSTTPMTIIAPSMLLTNQISSEHSETDEIVIAPEIAYIRKEQKTAKVNIELNNNYSNTISEVVILGVIPFVGNDYAISNTDMGSTFSTTIMEPGITIPEELKDYVKVYYSTNENPTKDLTDEANGWTETPEDFSKVKTFLIDLGEKVMSKEEVYNFSYQLQFPEGLNYDDIAYCHYGLYFSLDTEEGKYRTLTEPNKLGFMIAKEYELELIKYQTDKNKVVQNAVYRILEDGEQESTAKVTDENGTLKVQGLLLGRTYKIKEIKSPEQYELNENEVVFTTYEEDSDIGLTLVSGDVRSAEVIKEEGVDSRVQIKVEDEVKVDLEILKLDLETNETLPNVRFKITGKGLSESGKILTTNSNGKILLSGLYMDEEYTIEEVYSKGYFLNDPVTVKVVNENGEYKLTTTGTVKSSTTDVVDEIPTIKLELENRKVTTYNIEITKLKKDTLETLAGVKFKLYNNNKEVGEYETDENGKITISNLYTNNSNKGVTNIYTLKEILAPTGFTKIKDLEFRVDDIDGMLNYVQESEITNTIDATIENNTLKLTIENSSAVKLVKKDGTTGNVLPGSKFAIYNIDNYVDEVAKDRNGNILGQEETINGITYNVLTTNENGEITANLQEGIYKAIEVAAPYGYKLAENIDDRTYYFAVGASREGETGYKKTSENLVSKGETNEISEMATTSDGGIVYTGRFSGNLTLQNGDVIVNSNISDTEESYDSYIIKQNRHGDLEWFYQIGGVGVGDELLDVISTSDNSVLITGRIQETITLPNGETVSTNNASNAGLIMKMSENGELIWYDVVDGSGSDKMYKTAERISETGEPEYIVIGSFRSDDLKISTGETVERIDYDNAYIAIYSAEGSLKNFKTIASSDDLTPDKIVTTSDGGYIVTSEFYNYITIAGTEYTNSTSEELTIKGNVTFKLDSNFNVVWVRQITPTIDNIIIEDMVNSYDGGVIVAFYSEGELILDDNTILSGNDTFKATYLVKFNSDGTIGWTKVLCSNGEVNTYDLKKSSDGNYLLTLRIYGEIVVDGTTIVNEIYYGHVFKLDENGTLILNLSPRTAERNKLTASLETEDGTILTAGYCKETIDGNSYETNYIFKYNEVNLHVMEETLAHVYAGAHDDVIKGTEKTADGGFVAVGHYSEGAILTDGTVLECEGDLDSIVLKYDIFGRIESYKGFGGSNTDFLSDVVVNDDGGYTVVGYTYSKQFTLPNGEIKEFSNGNKKGIWIRFDKNGNQIDYGIIQGLEKVEIQGIEKTPDGGMVVVGNVEGILNLENDVTVSSKGDSDALIIKYNSEYEVEWARAIGGTLEDELEEVAVLTDGSVVAVGFYTESVILPDGTELSAAEEDPESGIIIKYDSQGNFVKGFGLGHKIKSVEATLDGGYAVGMFMNKYNSVNDENGNSLGGVVLAKYNSKDKADWYSVLNGYGYITDIKITKDGDYIVSGHTDAEVLRLNIGEEIRLAEEYYGTYAGFVSRIGTNGKQIWVAAVNGLGNDIFEGVTELKDGSIVAAGYFNNGSITLNNGETITSSDTDTRAGIIVRYIDSGATVEDEQEITAYNYIETFNITTDIIENNGVKGGTISGEDSTPYEIVSFGNNSTKEIKIIPEDGYKVSKVLVNDEEVEFTIAEDNTVTISQFTNVTEDKHIEVSLMRVSNEFTLEKVSEKDNTPMAGVIFKIEQVEGVEELSENIIAQTNAEGKIVIELPIGTYTITETATLEGYQLLEEPITYTMTEDTSNILTVKNTEYSKVIVHHYLENSTTSLADDEILYGKAGEEYLAVPRFDIDKYELIKDENEEYVIPSNSSGVYEEDNIIEVTYYYTQKKIPVKVNHYIEGTTENVILSNNEIAESIVQKGLEGESYTTEALGDELHPKYELVQIPANANGTYSGDEIIVNYYYRVKEFKITTLTTNAGGTITSQEQEYHEIVKYGEGNTKQITVVPEENYYVQTITINDEDYEFTENADKSVNIAMMSDITEDIQIVATFAEIPANVIVHHYIKDTTEGVPTSSGIASDEIKNGTVGNTYATKPLDDVLPMYEAINVPENSSGIMTEQDIEVTYYYDLKSYDYTIEYYYNDIKDEEKTVTNKVVYGTEIDTYEEQTKTGYKLGVVENFPLTVSEITENNIIKVYYVTDEEQTKELSYTIEYYQNGEIVESDTNTVKETVQVLEPDVLTVNTDEINTLDKYYGYKFEKSEPETIPDTVSNGDVIKVYYITDEAQTKELNYTVEYYKDNVKVEEDTDIVKETVQVLESDILTVDKDAINITNKYTGYVLDKLEPEVVPDTIENNGVIKVYYVRDSFEYTVEYYYNDIKDEEKTITEEALYGDEVSSYAEQVKTGYKLGTVENFPLTISEISENNVIKVYYVTDEEQTKELSYTVEYYKDNVKVEEDTNIVKETVQYLESDIMTVNKDEINILDKYYGYKLDKENQQDIPDTVNNGDVIKVYYITDETQTKELSYTVEYYKDNVKVEEDTNIVKETVQVLKPDTLTVDKDLINATDKYLGYVFDKLEPEVIPDTIENNGVIKVYYVRDTFEYTVEYYYNDIKDDSKTVTAEELYGDEVSSYAEQVKTGYKLGTVENFPLTITEITENNIIKVYYVTDEAQTKELNYTVEYYKDNVKVEEDTDIVKETVQVLESDILTVDKDAINVSNKYTGYVFDTVEPEVIPDTIENNGVIKVYYVRDTFDYTIEYYYGDIKDDSKTVTEKALYNEVIDEYSEEIKEGYKFYKTENYPLTISEISENNVIKVYYVTDETQIKELSYSVEYYQDDIKIDTDVVKETVQVLESDILTVDKDAINITNKYTGYVFDKLEPEVIPDTIENNGIIKVYYVRDSFEYTVEYYYNDIKDDEKTTTEEALYGEEVSSYTEQIKPGYKLGTVENFPLTITEITENNVIKVYYVTDEAQTKELSYTIEYYQNGEIVESDTSTVKENVQVLEPDVLTVNTDEINMLDKYYGYKFEKSEPETIPNTASNGDVIKVYYVTDEAQTKELSYTVEYYQNGEIVESDTNTVKENVQVLESDVLTVNTDEINTLDKYYGYKFIKTEPETIPTIIDSGNVIKVYYEIDPDQVKELNYTVEYYKDNVKVEEDANIVKETVQVLESDVLTVNTDEINILDKYYGYKFIKTEPETIPTTIDSGNVIKVYYEIDPDQVKELNYTVEYYKDNVKVKEDTNIVKETVQVLEPDVLTVNTDEINMLDKYYGYKFEKSEPETIPNTATNGDVIKVYYITDEAQTKELSYTVEYYKGEEKTDSEIVKETVHVLEPDALTVDRDSINTTDKYLGYKFEKTNPEIIPDVIDNGTVISVYYIIDDSQTKELKYNVEYYKDDVKVEEETFTQTVQILEEDELTVDKSKINTTDRFVGYTFNKTEPEEIPDKVTDGTIIKVYYSKGQFEYSVEYYYDDVKDESNTEKGTALLDEEISTYVLKEKEGYEFYKTENFPLIVTEKTENNVIKVYYTRKESQVISKFIDINTGEEISDEEIKTGKVFDEYQLTEKEIDGYVLVEKPEEMNGEFTEEDQTKVFKYAKQTSVIVKHLEKDSEEVLAEEKIIEGYEGKEYETTKEEIDNYTFVESTDNTEGTMTIEQIEVIYYYAQNTKVTVNYIDKNSNEIIETITENGKVGDLFETEAKDFENYVLIEEPENPNVVMQKEEIIVNYYYAKVSSGVIEKHIDITNEKLLDSKLYTGNEGDEYITSSKEFEGYDLVEEKLPENAEGIMTVEPIEVKYYYIRKASVRVEYRYINTNETISDDLVIIGYEGDSYTTESMEIEGYELLEEKLPENANGTMEVKVDENGNVNTETVVTYYYAKLSAGVIEKHIDIKTNEIIKENKYQGYVGDQYQTKSEIFENYELVEEQMPENEKGVMTEEVIEVEYYYIRKITLKVQYIEKSTDNKLKDDITINGYEGDEYTTTAEEFEGYKLIETPSNKEGILSREDTSVIYYYVKETSVRVQYIEKSTGDKLREDIVITGYEGDEYTTTAEEFEGLELVETPGNKDGKMSRNEIVVTYYYEELRHAVPETPEIPDVPQISTKPQEPEESEEPKNPEQSEKPKEEPKVENPPTIVIGKEEAKEEKDNNSEKIPSTGDMTPIISIAIIIIVINLNIVQILFMNTSRNTGKKHGDNTRRYKRKERRIK